MNGGEWFWVLHPSKTNALSRGPNLWQAISKAKAQKKDHRRDRSSGHQLQLPRRMTLKRGEGEPLKKAKEERRAKKRGSTADREEDRQKRDLSETETEMEKSNSAADGFSVENYNLRVNKVNCRAPGTRHRASLGGRQGRRLEELAMKPHAKAQPLFSQTPILRCRTSCRVDVCFCWGSFDVDCVGMWVRNYAARATG